MKHFSPKRLIQLFPVALVLLSGCAGLSFKARYDAYGVYGQGATQASAAVSSVEAIKVFIGTSPEGFTLRENELSIEKGFTHTILGRVQVEREKGFCDVGNPNRATVIKVMQERAFKAGGNAVIYAYSELGDEPSHWDACRTLKLNKGVFGGGWIVKLAN